MLSKILNKPSIPSGNPYDKVEENEELLSESDTIQIYPPRSRQPSWLLTTLLVLLFSIISALLGAWAGSKKPLNLDALCIRYTNQYSPAVDEADVSYNTIRFNGSLLKPNVFRQDAGPEVDAAWKSLGVDYRSVLIPVSKAAESGIQPDQVKINHKYGGGFPANVEGLHHLHCLNLVRQTLWFNYDYYHKQGEGAFVNDDNIVKFHVTHCLDIIRQQLMCQIDTGVLGQVWVQPGRDSAIHSPNHNHGGSGDTSLPFAYVDFNTNHKCKDFDAVRRWAEAHQLPERPPPDYLEPPKEGDTIYSEIP